MADLSKIAETAAELIDSLEEELASHGNVDHATVEVGIVGVVAEINYTGEDGEEYTVLQYRTSDSRKWVQAGLYGQISANIRSGADD